MSDNEKNLTNWIEEVLTREVLQGVWRPGQTFPSENESVKRFKVSRVTVRRAYANLAEKRIIVRKVRCRTEVSNHLIAATDPITFVGALFPFHNDFTSVFLESLNLVAAREDALLVLPRQFQDSVGQNKEGLSMVSHGVRNLIVWGCDRGIDLELFQRFRLLGINLVFFDHIKPGKIADYVSIDTAHAIASLFQKAHEDGCRSFLFVNAGGLSVDSNAERLAAFEAFCRKGGLCARVESLPWQKILQDGAPDECRALFESLADVEKTAIFCANAFLANAISQAVGGRGRYYSISTSELPLGENISTIRQPMSQMAQKCFELLCEQQKLGAKWVAKEHRIAGTPSWLEKN